MENDLNMPIFLLQWDRGNPLLKEIATYVTTSIDDDGIYKACLHLGLFDSFYVDY